MGTTTLLARRTKLGRLIGIPGTIQPSIKDSLDLHIQDAIRDIYNHERWDFQQFYSRVEMEKGDSFGTASVSAGGTAWTGADTAWDTGWTTHVRLFAAGNNYRIASVDSTTALTATDAALTDLTTVNYVLYISQYTLDSTLESIEAITYDAAGGRLKPVTPAFFDSVKAQGFRQGRPEIFTQRGVDASGNTIIEIWPIPEANRIMEITGYKVGTIPVNDGGTDDIPQRFSNVVDHRAEFYMWKQKNDPRMQVANSEYGRELIAMVDRHAPNQGPQVIQLDPNVHRHRNRFGFGGGRF